MGMTGISVPDTESITGYKVAMTRSAIKTENAPQAIGTYSQAVKSGNTVYLSGQIPLDPQTMELVLGDIETQIRQAFKNLSEVAKAAGGGFEHVVKINVYLTDLSHFPLINHVMKEFFQEPFPARAAVGVAALPGGARIELDAVMMLE